MQEIGHQVIRMVSELEEHLIEDGNLLSPETVTDEPIGRRAELEELHTCLTPMLRNQSPLNTWVCGPPGSGKSLLVRWAVECTCGAAGSRISVYVNCWQHRSLYSVPQAIINRLKILGAEAQDTNVKLDRIRQALRGRLFVVILDESDRPMPAQREEIIYGLLNLPKVGLICVANSTQALAAAAEQAGSSGLDLRLINPILKQWHSLAEETKLIGVTGHEKMILQVARTRGPLGTTTLAQAYRTSCRMSGIPPVAQRTFSKYLSRLAALGLLRVADRPMAQGGRLVRVAKPGADRMNGGFVRSPSVLVPPRIRR